MTPDTLIAILAATLLATAWGLYVLPVGTCKECAHCRLAKAERQREHEAQMGRLYGTPLCPTCGRIHQRDEEHRP